MDKILKLLETNARFTNEQIAAALGMETEAVAQKIEQYEKDGVIRGYSAIINYDKLPDEPERLTAIIELKVTPKKLLGFEEIARTIMLYDEVESVYLMSGGYDLAITIVGKSFKEIAAFVYQKVSMLDSVVSTATHFVLSRYKDKNIILYNEPEDERGVSFL